MAADDGRLADDDAGAVSMKKWSPICAPGWMSMPVEEWASSDITRAVSVMPS